MLLEHNEITDAAAVGITLHGEEWPRAYVALQEGSTATPEQIQNWIKDRVAKHKRLVGGVAIVDEVPKLQSGKIQRKLMREWAKRDAPELEKTLGPDLRSKL